MFSVNGCLMLSNSNTFSFLYKSYLTQVAKENADVIIMDDNFATIVNVAKWGRAIYINIQKFVQFQLTVNIVALVINFVSACITGLLTYRSSVFLSNVIISFSRNSSYSVFFYIFFQDLLHSQLFSCFG